MPNPNHTHFYIHTKSNICVITKKFENITFSEINRTIGQQYLQKIAVALFIKEPHLISFFSVKAKCIRGNWFIFQWVPAYT